MFRKPTSARGRRLILLAAAGLAVAVVAPLYAIGADDKPIKKAEATLVGPTGAELGTVEFKQEHDVVRVKGKVEGIPAGFHGFHVHSVGSCVGPTFASAGPHLNPAAVTHRNHAGDMPVLLVNADGTAEATFDTDRFSVDDLFDGDGSAVIVHANADNYANIPTDRYDPDPDATTLATGDAGGRIACGVVESKHDK